MPLLRMALGTALVAWATTARAADSEPSKWAIGADSVFSTDAENTQVFKTGFFVDVRHKGPEDYLGFRLEEARFRPLGQASSDRQRAYVRAASTLGKWKWNATAGTDGRTVLGSAGIHDESKFRKELFLEREIVETPLGLSRGIYYTFAGAALDLPANEDNVLTLVAGVQKFTGDNVRTHARATFVHVASRRLGLSVQLRTRYFHDSVPREYDYYSPRWYAQAVPVLQVRRFVDGWRYLVAGGVGVQRDNGTSWRRSSYFNAQVTSPPKRGWSGNASALFSETPTATGNSYNFFQLSLGVTRAL
ncbi:MAG: hypothetical protein ABIW33_03275 [Sphingomicrobium sp.]